MDCFLHGFWGFTLAKWFFPKNKVSWFWGTLLGILPDLLGAGPWIYYRNILKVYNLYQIPQWTIDIYSSTHNLFTAGLIFIIIYFINKKYLLLGSSYLLHVTIDILAHCKPIGTKIFFPLSDWSYCSPLYKAISGPSFVSWTSGLAFLEIIQYLFLVVINFWLFIKRGSDAD